MDPRILARHGLGMRRSEVNVLNAARHSGLSAVQESDRLRRREARLAMTGAPASTNSSRPDLS